MEQIVVMCFDIDLLFYGYVSILGILIFEYFSFIKLEDKKKVQYVRFHFCK